MKTQKYMLFVLLSAITAMCVWIWAWADVQYTTVVSDNGTWDLRGANFLSPQGGRGSLKIQYPNNP